MATLHELAHSPDWSQCCECLRAFTSPGRVSAHRKQAHRRCLSRVCAVCEEPVEVAFEDYHRGSNYHKFAVAYHERNQAKQAEQGAAAAATAQAPTREHAPVGTPPPAPPAPPAPPDALPPPRCGAGASGAVGFVPSEAPDPPATLAEGAGAGRDDGSRPLSEGGFLLTDRTRKLWQSLSDVCTCGHRACAVATGAC